MKALFDAGKESWSHPLVRWLSQEGTLQTGTLPAVGGSAVGKMECGDICILGLMDGKDQPSTDNRAHNFAPSHSPTQSGLWGQRT